jgi:hypothetical protein
MFTKRILIALCLFLCLFGMSAETLSAQILRRQLQRIPALRQPLQERPSYRVGQPLSQNVISEPIIQGDGRAGERIRNIINLFTEGGKELKPVAVISFASFDSFKRVIQIVAKQIRLDKGSLDEPMLLNAFLNVYERIIGRGLDTSQPFGVILQTDGALFYPLVFTPMNINSKTGESFKNDYAEQLPDGRYAIRQEIFRWPLGRLYVQEHNGWVFIASEQQLNALPDDPTVLLQGLDHKHLIAAKFDLQTMPALTTRTALSFGEMRAVAEAETEIEKATARLGIGYLRSLAEQADYLEYTVSYDAERNDYVIEQKEIVKPKTERARLMQERRNAVSPLHGFYHPEGAILASHFVMPLTKSQREQFEIILNEAIGKKLLPDKKEAEALASDNGDKEAEVITSASETFEHKLFHQIGVAYYTALIGAVRNGKIDGASTCSMEHGILAAYNIVEGEQFRQEFDVIFETMKKEFPELYEKNVEKDYAEAEGFTLTSVAFHLGDFIKNPVLGWLIPPEISKRETRLILGVRNDAVCFAVGQGKKPELQILEAIAGTKEPKRVDDHFFVYSAYELGQAFAATGDPNRLVRLKQAALDTNLTARADAVSKFTENTKTLTLRISGLLTPSLWRLRENTRFIR